MSKKSKSSSLRPKLEVLIILVFFLSFIIWAASKCNASQIQDQFADLTTTEDQDSTEEIEDPYGTPLSPPDPAPSTTANPTPNTPSETATNPSQLNITDPSQLYSKLYVTINGLNMRTGPHLDSTILYKLPLFEEVWFLNEVTDSTQKISLGSEIADEPWVKIKHKKGRVGWVYGAGVNYYRKERLTE